MPQGALLKVWARRLAALGAVFALAACVAKNNQVQPEPAAPEVAARTPAPVVSQAYETAAAAYAAGDYHRAAELFEPLARDDAAPALAQRAAYGLACSLLLAAETRDDYKAALAKWSQWQALAPRADAPEDPRMLTPLLHVLRQPSDNREAAKFSKADAECAKRLTEKEKEVRLLNNQIKALEKIHRDIQERKKELSSP
jgi:outer membrane protein assembly factor BamD (BamD/ComL family)